LKEHDRLTLTREQMLRRTKGRRGHSKLPRLIEYALSRPLVSSAMIEKELQLTTTMFVVKGEQVGALEGVKLPADADVAIVSLRPELVRKIRSTLHPLKKARRCPPLRRASCVWPLLRK
jgi:hypothetical protein